MVAQTQKTHKPNLNNINLYYRATALVCRNISPHGGEFSSGQYKTELFQSLHSETTWLFQTV